LERRYHSPYRHWFSGFLFEVAVFGCFLAALAAMSLAILWLAG
jgi:hypothetical protein